jgi:glucose-6-phosphate isomerase
MCNVFAQMDALAFGKNKIELEEELCPSDLLPYKTFDGNRPSLLLLFDELTPRNIGYLMSIYEHRTAVIGFYLGINSFDQWGVELGKQLATKIKHKMEGNDVVLNNSTENMLKFYFDHRNKQSSEP